MPVIGGLAAVTSSLFLNVRDFGAVGNGTTDDTSAIQTALNATTGGIVHIPLGTFNHTTLTIPVDTELRITPGATLSHTVATEDGVRVSARGRLTGGGRILSPATWDGTQGSWTYAVVKITGDDATVEDITLINVPTAGIGVKDADNPRITRNRVFGNYPANLWDENGTVHFGIVYDASPSSASGRGIISLNHVKSCVQGTYVHNLSSGFGTGLTITGNSYDGCHNHGVYIGGGWASVNVSSNTFVHCSRPVTAQGNGHLISSNTMWTSDSGTNLDTPGIAVREATDTIVANNILKGEGRTGFVVIDVQNNSGTDLIGNRITGNIVDVTGGSVIGIRVGTPPQTVNIRDNVIKDNFVSCTNVLGSCAIAIYGNDSTPALNNVVSGNTIVVKGPQNAINATSQDNATIERNEIRFEYDSPSAITVGAITLNPTTNSKIDSNDVYNSSAYGTNVSIRGIWEKTGSSNNSASDNKFRFDTTKLASGTPLVMLSGSGTIINQTAAGAPTITAGTGSRYFRTDGGASTTLYVKESGSASTVWVAK